MTDKPVQADDNALRSDPATLEVRLIAGSSRPTGPCLVFLHEGLGSITAWEDFPDRLCEQTGLPGLIYSRRGYGRSAPLGGPLGIDFLHREALDELPALLALHDVEDVILVGHSDGASIAVIHAAHPERAGCRIHGVIAIAPHLFVEQICVDAIQTLADRISKQPDRLVFLGRHHDDAAAVFHAWSQAWLTPAFHALDLCPEAGRIRCPVLAVQGRDDHYGTLAQVERLSGLAEKGQMIVLENCKHSPHLQAPQALLECCTRFVETVLSETD